VIDNFIIFDINNKLIMTGKEAFLLEVPKNFNRSELKNITTLQEVEKIFHRMGHTV